MCVHAHEHGKLNSHTSAFVDKFMGKYVRLETVQLSQSGTGAAALAPFMPCCAHVASALPSVRGHESGRVYNSIAAAAIMGYI